MIARNTSIFLTSCPDQFQLILDWQESMTTQHLYKLEEVETVKSAIAENFLCNEEAVWIDGNQIRSIKSGRRTVFPLRFNIRLHKDTRFAWALNRAEKLTGTRALNEIDLEDYDSDNHVILGLNLNWSEFNRILTLANASIPNKT